MLQLYSMKFKKIVELARGWYTNRNVFILTLILFSLLLYKDPFGQRTLIPNLEPYPDTIHYIVPTRSLISGGPFKILREGRILSPNVPPLYSLVLIPFYLINNDARMFYYANVFLSFLSFLVFYQILKRITKNTSIILFSLFLFATNYYLSW